MYEGLCDVQTGEGLVWLEEEEGGMVDDGVSDVDEEVVEDVGGLK